MREVYIDESFILLDLEGETKEEILHVMAKNLQQTGVVKDSFIDAIIARENTYPTGLPTKGVSVAIPHTDPEHVNKKTISIGRLKDTVDFSVMGGDGTTTPVKLIFMLAMDQPHSQLSLLQKLVGIFQDEATLNYLATEENRTNIKELVISRLEFSHEESQ